MYTNFNGLYRFERKYHLVNDPLGLYQIIADRDIPRYGVKVGDKGGLVSNEGILSQSDDCWIDTSSIVTGSSHVRGNSLVECSEVSGRSYFTDNAVVRGSFISGAVAVMGNARLNHVTVTLGRFDGNANVAFENSFLVVDSISTQGHHGTLYRTSDGGWEVTIGCWRGTLDELEFLIGSKTWPSGVNKKTRKLYTPRFKAAIKLFRAHAKAFS